MAATAWDKVPQSFESDVEISRGPRRWRFSSREFPDAVSERQSRRGTIQSAAPEATRDKELGRRQGQRTGRRLAGGRRLPGGRRSSALWISTRDLRRRARALLDIRRCFAVGINAAGSPLEGRDPGMTWDGELERATERITTRGFRQPPRLPTPCPRFSGGFPLGVKANAEASVWRSHAASTTTSSDQGTKNLEEEPTRSGRPLFPEGGAVLRAPGIGPCIACWCS